MFYNTVLRFIHIERLRESYLFFRYRTSSLERHRTPEYRWEGQKVVGLVVSG
jgi:hypothetical protein